MNRRLYVGPVLYLLGKTTKVPNGPSASCGTPDCHFEKLVLRPENGRRFCGGCGKEYEFKESYRERQATFGDFMFDESNPASKQHIDRLYYPNDASFLIPNMYSDMEAVAIIKPSEYPDDEPGIPFPLHVDEDEIIEIYQEHYAKLLADLTDYGFTYSIELKIVYRN